MTVPAKLPDHDPVTGEVTTSHGLPAGFMAGNQSLAVSIAMAEVDQQITTAHAYPRSIDRAVKNIMSLATLDEDTAAECVYALPRGGKPIKGPSIRLAEIIQSQWCNNRVGTRIVHVDRIEKYVEAEAVFHDLETNSATTARVRRRLTNKKNELLTEDMIIVTGNAASSIAKRNAILGGVPKAVWRSAYAAVEKVIAGDAKTLVERRGDAMKAFAAFGVTPERVLAALELHGLDDITLEHMSTLIGMHSALKNGEATVEEMFPLPKGEGEKQEKADLKGRLDQLAGNETNTAADATKPAETASSGSTPAEQATQPGEAASSAEESSARSDGAATDSASSQTSEGGVPDAVTEPPADSPPAPSAGGDRKRECVQKMLAIVADKQTSPEDKAAILAEAADMWAGELDDKAFVTSVFDTAKKVLRGELTAAKATKFLEGII